jgi:hypothetical protein
MKCPSCGSPFVLNLGKCRARCPMGLAVMFGFAFTTLHKYSAPRNYRCDSCGLDFAQRTLAARLVRLFLLTFAFGMALYLLVAMIGLMVAGHG